MRHFLLLLAPLAFLQCAPAAAQKTILAGNNDTIRYCGFRSRNAADARAYLTNAFDTLIFSPGERIADIGAQSGNLAGILSLFYDDVDITLEDINPRCLNPAQVRATLRYYYGIREQEPPKAFRTRVVIGTESSTLLPDAAYTKVFFLNTFHEVTQQPAMLAELARITAPGGMLYVTEKVSTSKQVKRKDCGHTMPIEHELVQAFGKAGFSLVKTKERDHYKQKGDVVKYAGYQFRKD